LFIAAMTGGTDEAAQVNMALAAIAEELGLGFGLGSQRAMHVRKDTAFSYDVRKAAKSTLVLGNVGVVQAAAMSVSEVRALVDAIGADALCVHLNPAMELVQPGGDRDFRRGTETLGQLAEGLGVPVVAKETGCGLSLSVARRLRQVGVEHVDVSGAGGTSWVAVETKRADARGQAAGKALGEALWDWGIPTAASVAMVKKAEMRTIIATGGVTSGMDVAKAIALGASAGGIARPVLRAFKEGGHDGAKAFLTGVINELRAVMLLTGSKDLAALAQAPRLIGGELAQWMAL
jgi:isopentenyl-diphosphate delta-isomerase